MTTTPSSRSSGPWGVLGTGAAAVAACAVCCAGPLLAVLGGIGVTSVIGALWMPVLAVLAVAAAVGFAVVRRRRKRDACRPTPAPADLGMPTVVAPPRDSAAPR